MHRRVLSLLALGGLGDTPLGAIKLAMNVLGVPISPPYAGPPRPSAMESARRSRRYSKGRVWRRSVRGRSLRSRVLGPNTRGPASSRRYPSRLRVVTKTKGAAPEGRPGSGTGDRWAWVDGLDQIGDDNRSSQRRNRAVGGLPSYAGIRGLRGRLITVGRRLRFGAKRESIPFFGFCFSITVEDPRKPRVYAVTSKARPPGDPYASAGQKPSLAARQ